MALERSGHCFGFFLKQARDSGRCGGFHAACPRRRLKPYWEAAFIWSLRFKVNTLASSPVTPHWLFLRCSSLVGSLSVLKSAWLRVAARVMAPLRRQPFSNRESGRDLSLLRCRNRAIVPAGVAMKLALGIGIVFGFALRRLGFSSWDEVHTCSPLWGYSERPGRRDLRAIACACI
ncbi:MAG: hypothetical protein RJA70_2217 [Pseudomonadota bacterium]